MKTFVRVDCGCTVEAEHLTGQRRIFCKGGGEVDAPGSVQAEFRIKCEGGKPWTLTARPVIRYDVQPYGVKP